MKSIKILTLFIFCFLLMNNFVFSQQIVKYFPLNVGNYYLYRYGKTSTIEKRIIKYIPAQKTYLMEILNKLSNLPAKKIINFYKIENNKIYLTGISYSGHLSDMELKHPADLILNTPIELNSEWIEFKSAEEKKINRVIGFTDCEVPAGKFTNVCKIQSTVYYKYNSKISTLKTFEYYAPNIGLIKTDTIDEAGNVNTYLELLNYHIEK